MCYLGETSLTIADGVKSSALLTRIAGLEINCGDSGKKKCELLNGWLKKSPQLGYSYGTPPFPPKKAICTKIDLFFLCISMTFPQIRYHLIEGTERSLKDSTETFVHAGTVCCSCCQRWKQK